MATRQEGEETEPEQAVRRHRRTRAQIEDLPIPEPAPEPEPEPEPVPEPVPAHTSPHTCVFCNQESQVDPDNLEGARFISEPSLGIRNFVCAGCNDA